MKVIRCTHARHADAILAIFNEAIVTSTALFDYEPRTPQFMMDWFASKEAAHLPVIGIENDLGELLGFASYGSFRAWPAYKYTVEHSVYVHKDHRGKGMGQLLMKELIKAAKTQNLHLLVGCIEASNHASIALHQACGFTHAGTISQAGFKFGKWLDLSMYQLVLETPATPVDG